MRTSSTPHAGGAATAAAKVEASPAPAYVAPNGSRAVNAEPSSAVPDSAPSRTAYVVGPCRVAKFSTQRTTREAGIETVTTSTASVLQVARHHLGADAAAGPVRMGRMPDETPRPVETWLTDMDGVLVHEEVPIAGATEFVEALKASGLGFLVLTNNSIYTPRDLRARLLASGIDVPEKAIWTSALATADFLADQRPHGTAYVVGEAGLTTALHDIGYVMTDRDPDYVVLGETRTYSFESITRAIRLIDGGARFIATNPDASGPSHQGQLPATGSVAALIRTATGRAPYFIGKPNPLMMRSALNRLEAHSETTVMVGDRMDTDIISGLEAGLRTVLVTTGSTRPEDIEKFPYRPTRVVDSIADLVADVRPVDPESSAV